MADTVFCVKTQKDGERLHRVPYPNELGQRIYDSISQDGWQLWIAHSTMLVNEFRVDVSSKQGTEFLLKQCEDFFFGEGGELPPDFKPEGDDAKAKDELSEGEASEGTSSEGEASEGNDGDK